jgi:hypothetical protein
MPQVFPRSSNVWLPAGIVGLAGLSVLGVLAIMGFDRSRYATDVGVAKRQPVQFSHQHHVSHLGLHCVYCHTSVEVSSFAGIPPTHTCMSCHSQLWVTSPMLEPVRASYRTGESIEWNRIHDLPQYVFFNHSIHLKKGIGCSSCHGRVDEMNLTYKAASLQMEWCLNCHREPEKYIRPRELVFQMDYEYPPNQLEVGRKLVEEYKVQKLLDCYTCHR